MGLVNETRMFQRIFVSRRWNELPRLLQRLSVRLLRPPLLSVVLLLARPSVVERQLVMHGLDLSSLARLASMCR